MTISHLITKYLKSVCFFISLLLSIFLLSSQAFSGPCREETVQTRLASESSRYGLKPSQSLIHGIIQSFRACCEQGAPAELPYRLPNQKTFWLDCSLLGLSSDAGHEGDPTVAFDHPSGPDVSLVANSDEIKGFKFIAKLERKMKHRLEQVRAKELDDLAHTDRRLFSKANQEFIQSIGLAHSRDEVRIQRNLFNLEMSGLDLEQLRRAYNYYAGQKDRKTLVRLLGSRSLLRGELRAVLREFIRISLARPGEHFNLTLQDFSGNPKGLGLAMWKPEALRGLEKVLQRTSHILENSRFKTPRLALADAEKEFGISHNKSCRLCK